MVIGGHWRDVPEPHAGRYQVSRLGMVRTVQHSFVRSHGWRFTVRSRILQTYRHSKDGRLIVTVSRPKRTLYIDALMREVRPELAVHEYRCGALDIGTRAAQARG